MAIFEQPEIYIRNFHLFMYGDNWEFVAAGPHNDLYDMDIYDIRNSIMDNMAHNTCDGIEISRHPKIHYNHMYFQFFHGTDLLSETVHNTHILPESVTIFAKRM